MHRNVRVALRGHLAGGDVSLVAEQHEKASARNGMSAAHHGEGTHWHHDGAVGEFLGVFVRHGGGGGVFGEGVGCCASKQG
jgi:hypothetical protein